MTATAEYPKIHAQVQAMVARHVQGYGEIVTDLMVTAMAGGHVLLEGVPGVAKTTLAKSFATILGLSFKRIQFTQDLMPADITGHYFYDQKSRVFEIREGPLFANVVVADEINRSPAKTHSALLEAMEENQVTIEGTRLPLPRPFMVIATLNPVETEGVYRLPEAQLDRFLMRCSMGYLDAARELSILAAEVAEARNVPLEPLAAGFLATAIADVRKVKVGVPVQQYMQRLVAATRGIEGVKLGASPRAMVQLARATRARALLQGRAFVTPDDVKWAAPRVLAHRLLMDYDAEESGATRDALVLGLLRQIEVPKGLVS